MRARCSSGSTPVRRGGGGRGGAPRGGGAGRRGARGGGKRPGGGVSGSGSGARGRSSSSSPASERKRRSSSPSTVGASPRACRPGKDATAAGGGELARLQAGEGRDVVAGGRPERVEVALDQVLDRRGGLDRRRGQPVF